MVVWRKMSPVGWEFEPHRSDRHSSFSPATGLNCGHENMSRLRNTVDEWTWIFMSHGLVGRHNGIAAPWRHTSHTQAAHLHWFYTCHYTSGVTCSVHVIVLVFLAKITCDHSCWENPGAEGTENAAGMQSKVHRTLRMYTGLTRADETWFLSSSPDADVRTGEGGRTFHQDIVRELTSWWFHFPLQAVLQQFSFNLCLINISIYCFKIKHKALWGAGRDPISLRGEPA